MSKITCNNPIVTITHGEVDCLGRACVYSGQCNTYKLNHDCEDHAVDLGIIQRRKIYKCALCGMTWEG